MSASRHTAQWDRRRNEFYRDLRQQAGIGAGTHETAPKRPKIALRPENATVREFCPVTEAISIDVLSAADIGEWLCDVRAGRQIDIYDFHTMRAFAVMPTLEVRAWMLSATQAQYQEALIEMAKILEWEDAQMGGRCRAVVSCIDGG